MANIFHFEGEQKRARTFSDKKLRVRIFPVLYSTVRLWPLDMIQHVNNVFLDVNAV